MKTKGNNCRTLLLLTLLGMAQYTQAQWKVTGNAGTTNSNFLGTTDNKSLKIKTNNVQRALFDSIGRISLGNNSIATGLNAVSIGTNTNSTNSYSLAMGANTTASGSNSTAMGYLSASQGALSTAMGYQTLASGPYSTSMGSSTTASSDKTTAMGFGSTASGEVSTAMGHFTSAPSFAETVIGTYNTTYSPSSTSVWNAADRLFVVGNGSGPSARSNALTILKNGNMGIGNSNPTAKLEVSGAIKIVDGTQAQGRLLTCDANGSASWQPLSINTGWASSGPNIYSTNSGNVGIGIYIPTQKLDVDGNINLTAGKAVYFGGTKGISVNSASWNNALGSYALQSVTSGSGNNAFGQVALGALTTGFYNTSMGHIALSSNTTGSGNTALGSGALSTNTTGGYNTALGYDALSGSYALLAGANNTAVGYAALYQNFGYNNTAIGNAAGINNGAANGNLISYATAIGNNAAFTTHYQIQVGTSANNNKTGGYGNWQNFSDGRFKDNVKANVPGLDFITKLRPVTYNLNAEKIDQFLGIKQRMDTCSDERQKADYFERLKEVQSQSLTGFIAQEVESSAKAIGYNFDGVHHPENDKDHYSIAYATIVVPLVKSVQELNSMNNAKDERITDQQKQINNLNCKLNVLAEQLKNFESAMSQCCTNFLSEVRSENAVVFSDAARLEQNSPNPFSENTVIRYYIPSTAKNAVIEIISHDGKVLKSLSIAQKGVSQIVVSANSLATGNYLYRLVIDGIHVDTKGMVLTK